MKKTLVIGASLKIERYSNMAINLLRRNGFDVVAFGLRKGIVADVEIQTAKIDFDNIHTVTMYINPHRQPEIYEYILSLNPKRVIFNPGTENYKFAEVLRNNGIIVIENCTLVMLNSSLY